MHPRPLLILFMVFAPVTVPVYVLFLAVTNLLGGAFYIVIEASIARLLGRPITLSRGWMALLAVPVLAAAPVATTGHLVLWLLRSAGHLLCLLGHWQTGARTQAWSFAGGLVWSLAAGWTTITCLNAALGLVCIGKAVEGRDAFVEHLTRHRTLGDMPADMQRRRAGLIRDLQTHQGAIHPQWEFLLEDLRDDHCQFSVRWLPTPVLRRLAGLPWFFLPGEVSDDGADHSVMLLGPLLFVWMLLVRWPGTFFLLRRGWLRAGGFILRTTGTVYAVYGLVAWVPWTAYTQFRFDGEAPSVLFKLLSPALWIDFDVTRWVRPEWYLFNAGLWLVLLGLMAVIWWLAWRVGPLLGWPRYYVAFLASRLLQRKRIAFFSVGAVTLCVAMMIIVISVMGGFVDSIRERAHGLLADLVMDGGETGFPFYEEFIEEIHELRDEQTGELLVAQATPLIHAWGILQLLDQSRDMGKTKAVRIWGVKLDEYVRVNKFGQDLFYDARFGDTTLAPGKQPVWGFDDSGVAALPGTMDQAFRTYLAELPPDQRAEEEKRFGRLPGERYPGPGVIAVSSSDGRPGYEGAALPGVIIGRDIIARRTHSGEYDRSDQYPRGQQCALTVVALTRKGDVSTEPPPRPAFRYVDDSRTGIHEIDSMNVYIGFDELQRLLSMEALDRVPGTELFLASIPADHWTDLDTATLSEGLRAGLARHGVRLTSDAVLSVAEAGALWRIEDAGRAHVIRLDAGRLSVYRAFVSPRCSQIQIKLRGTLGDDWHGLQRWKGEIWDAWDRVRNRMPADGIELWQIAQVHVSTWEEMQSSYIAAIEKEKFLVLIMFGVISIVAVFLILCIFYMIVQEKTRDIGIIKSVGGSAEGVAAVFLAYGAAIGLVGSVLGSLLGIAFVEHINEIQDFLAQLNPDWRVWSPETYSFDKIPDAWKWSEIIWISILAVLASIAGAAFPAIRASRTWPVESLRYE